MKRATIIYLSLATTLFLCCDKKQIDSNDAKVEFEPTAKAQVTYSYTSYGKTGKPLVQGTFSLPRLTDDKGDISSTWKTKAIGESEFDNGNDDINFQTGSGKLRGQVKNGVVKIEFHPASWEDMGFRLTGKITNDGFRGTWSFTCDAGDYNDRGKFVATIK